MNDRTKEAIYRVRLLVEPHRVGSAKLKQIARLIEDLADNERAAGYADAQEDLINEVPDAAEEDLDLELEGSQDYSSDLNRTVFDGDSVNLSMSQPTSEESDGVQ